MGRGGGATKREVKFYPYKKRGGGGKSFSHAEAEAQKFWGSFYAVAWRFSHIEGGGGAWKVSTV